MVRAWCCPDERRVREQHQARPRPATRSSTLSGPAVADVALTAGGAEEGVGPFPSPPARINGNREGAGTRFAINVLEEEQKDLSTCFARSGFDRFTGVEWYPGETGAPVLPNMLATLECAVTQMVEAGDHVVVIGEALHASWRDGLPLIYFNSSYQALRSGSISS